MYFFSRRVFNVLFGQSNIDKSPISNKIQCKLVSLKVHVKFCWSTLTKSISYTCKNIHSLMKKIKWCLISYSETKLIYKTKFTINQDLNFNMCCCFIHPSKTWLHTHLVHFYPMPWMISFSWELTNQLEANLNTWFPFHLW
jgi:hypothetical protein